MTDVVIDNSAAVLLSAKATLGVDHVQHYAPELIDLEYASALRKMVMRGELEADEASAYIEDWSANSLIRCNHTMLLHRVWELRHSITPHDASYVALAERLEAPLVTADKRLARAASAFCEVLTLDG